MALNASYKEWLRINNIPHSDWAVKRYRELADMDDIEVTHDGKTKTMLGMGPDAPTKTNDKGGSQSELFYRFDLIDPTAMFRLAHVLDYGAKKYGDSNWRDIPVRDHINHMLAHAFAYLQNDDSDDHLGHMLTRAMMAVAVHEQGIDDQEELREMVRKYIP